MFRNCIVLLFMIGLMIPAQGAWAEDSDTETRLKLLEKKLETMELEKMEAAKDLDERFAFNLNQLNPASKLMTSGLSQGIRQIQGSGF